MPGVEYRGSFLLEGARKATTLDLWTRLGPLNVYDDLREPLGEQRTNRECE
jgi:hypothetical protein